MTFAAPPRDHGGNLDAAIRRYGGETADWLDLSTGINPHAYPLPDISRDAFSALPRRAEMEALCVAAGAAYACRADVIPFAGAQGAIQAVPFLRAPGRALILGPTYNEHAAALTLAGWQVAQVRTLEELRGADLAVVVNPNNPDGTHHAPDALAALAGQVGQLVVDESFVDPVPHLSLGTRLEGLPEVIVLRSFGKFYGLAGLRLGFAMATGQFAARLSALAGPWPVAGPAIEIARQALADRSWQENTTRLLSEASSDMDRIAMACGWTLVGGTPLFRTYATPNAAEAQDRLAQARIWSRIFPYSKTWIRLGIAPGKAGLARLAGALSAETTVQARRNR